MELLAHPRKSSFRNLPVWKWTEACYQAERRRHMFMRTVRGRTDLTTEQQQQVALCQSCETKVHSTTDSKQAPQTTDSKQAPQGAVLVLDTETTGGARHDEVIQLGYVIYDSTGSLVSTYERVWKTSKPSNPFALAVHNIPDTLVQQSRFSAAEELEKFNQLTQQIADSGGVLVAHNAAFDVRLLHQTAQKHGLSFQPTEVFCTMKAIRKVPKTERGKSAKNTEVYNFLDGPPVSGTVHHARTDSLMTAHIYFTGKQKHWW